MKLDSTSPLVDQSYEISNLTFTAALASNAMTIDIKDKNGATPTGMSPCRVGFRNATSATGDYSTVLITAAPTSLVVPSGATLGTKSAIQAYLWVYLINNAGAGEIAISHIRYDEGSIVSTTTIDTASDVNRTIYSATGRSNVACRVIGRISSTQTTAGTWAQALTQLSLGNAIAPGEFVGARVLSTGTQSINNATYTNVNFSATATYDSHGCFVTDTFTVPVAGYYEASGTIEFADSALGVRYIDVRVNGTGVTGGAGISNTAGNAGTNSGRLNFNSGPFKCNVTDTIVVVAQQTTGSSMTLNALSPSYAQFTRVHPSELF